MTFYLKGHQVYQKSTLKLPIKSGSLTKMENLNLQIVVVLTLLNIRYNIIPHLKALTCSIEHASGQGHGNTFKEGHIVFIVLF